MAKLKTKFVDVGITAGSGGGFYGYSVTNGIGTVSDTANGSSDQTLDAGTVFSESTRVTGLYFQAFVANNVFFEVQGERANSSNSGWQTHTVGSNTYNRNDGAYFYNSSTNRTRWTWLTSGSAGSAANPYGTSTGADIEVSWDDEIPLGLTEALFTVSGSNSAWTTQTVDISAFADYTVRLVFHHELPATTVGNVFLGDLQLDDIRLDGTTYSFENTGHGWQTTTSNVQPNETSYCAATFATLAVGTTAGRWNVDTAGTGSTGTGLPTADAGSYYVYTETSSPVAEGDGFFLRSQSTVLGSSPTLQFAEARSGSNIGTLTVYLDVVAKPAAVAPTISDVTNDNATSSSVTVTVSLSNNGQGGTGLFYGRASTNNSDNVSSWQSSNTFTQSRSSNFYYFASRSSDTGASNTLASSGVLEAVPFLAPVVPQINQVTNDAYLQSGDTTFQHSNTTVNADTNGSRVQIRTGSYTGTVVATTSGSSATEFFTVNDAPAQNSSKTYYITYFRLESFGGSGSAGLTNYGTFTAYRAGDTAGTVTLDSKWIDVGNTTNTGGTFYGYSYVGFGDVSNTADGATNSSIENTYASATDLAVAEYQDYIGDSVKVAFSQSSALISDTTKVTKITIDGRDFALATANSFNSGSSPQRGFLSWTTNLASNPFGTTTGVNKLVEFKKETSTAANTTVTNVSLSANQTVDSIATISNAFSTQRYRIIKTSGSSAGGIANGAVVGGRTGGGTLAIDNSEQPGVGETCTYQVQTSGQHADFFTDSLYTDVTGTNNSFTITRSAVATAAPTISDVTNNNAAASSVTVTVTLSNNGQGGDGLFYGRASTNNSDNVTSWQTGNTFSQSRSSNFYYFASRSSDTGATNTLASSGVLEAVPFILPDSSISAANVTISGSSNTTASITVNGTTSGETIDIRPDSAPYTFVYASAVASSSTTVIPLTTNLPTQGNTTSYRLSATRPVAIGGDGNFDIGESFTVTRAADAAPTFTVTSNCAAAASVGLTFNISDEGSGGDGNLYYVADATNGITPPPFGWSTTQPTSQSRGTTIKYWVSRVSNGSSLTSSFPLQSGYIPPDVNVSFTPTSRTLSSGIASTTFDILNTTQHHLYRVFDTEQGVDVSNSSAGGTLTVTIPLAGVQDGDVIDAQVTAALATSRGGDGVPDDANTSSSIVVNIVDSQIVPSAFTFTDVSSASVGQIYDTFVQIVGTGGSTLTASSVSGTATFAVSTTTTTPASGFSQASKSISESEYLHVRMQASSSANTTVESTIEVEDREDNWRITTGALPPVVYGTEWYSDNTSSSFATTSLSSDIVTGRGTSAAVNCQTMLPGDQLAITVSNGPNSESSNLYVMFSEIGGRFENQFTDVKVNVGQTYTVTVADTFTGSCFVRLISELNYTTHQLPTSSLVTSTGYIPLHLKMPVIPQDYGLQIYAPNGTLLAIDQNTNVASLESTYATSVTLSPGASTTLSNDDIGDYGAVEYIVPGGVNTESLSGAVLLQIESTSQSGLKITNNSASTTYANLDFQFIRIF